MRPAMATERGEEVLHGGTANRGLVVRVGDTVRRPLRSTSPATQAATIGQPRRLNATSDTAGNIFMKRK